MILGKQIQKARKHKKITQKQLAEMINVATGTIQQYELNKREPSWETLQKISSALGMTIWELLESNPTRQANSNETDAEREKKLGLPEGVISNAPRAEDVEKQNQADMLEAMEKLNIKGQQEAVKRVRELGFVDEYKRRSLSDVWGYDEPAQK